MIYGFKVGALSFGPQHRPVSRLSQARTPQKRNRTGRTDNRPRTPRATRPRPKATATSRQPEPQNAAQKINFGGPIRQLFPHSKRPRIGFCNQGVHVLDSVPFSSTRTLDQACNLRPDTPPAARHSESWNVMPAVWSWQASSGLSLWSALSVSPKECV